MLGKLTQNGVRALLVQPQNLRVVSVANVQMVSPFKCLSPLNPIESLRQEEEKN